MLYYYALSVKGGILAKVWLEIRKPELSDDFVMKPKFPVNIGPNSAQFFLRIYKTNILSEPEPPKKEKEKNPETNKE